MINKKALLFYLIPFFIFLVFSKVDASNAPDLKEGTYLSGQTLSVWPSWALIGNAVGVSLPIDPINQLAAAGTCSTTTNRFCVTNNQCPTGESCILHDPETGWSVADRRFSFACSKDSYAYRYIASTTPGFYTVRARFEDPGISPGNYSKFVYSFISNSIFKINDSSGVCNFDQEISSMQSGVCGDGKLNLNKGEQCDPPGRIEYATGCAGSVKNLSVCGNTCQWIASTTLCSNFSKCGNGIKEFGETCDDGSLNGRYNHCNITCNGISPLGRCGDAILQSVYEVCDSGTPGIEKYGVNKAASCSWDCQNFGPYCGDNITQTSFGEECDGSQQCSVNGNSGTKVCVNCLKKDQDVSAWWRFEKMANPSQTLDSSVNGNTAACSMPTCPKKVLGKYGNGFAFNQNLNEYRFFGVKNSTSLMPTSSLTVEAWIFPTNTGTLYQRIIEKGGPGTGAGYDLEFNTAANRPVIRFNLWNNTQTSVDSSSFIPLNTWTHVVGTFQKEEKSNIVKIYINGVLENTITVDQDVSIMAADTERLFIGKSATENNNFFFGNLDEIKIYNRALSDSEIQNNYQSGWFCAVTAAPTPVATTSGKCGDAVVDVNETCDEGVAKNGRACVPTYGNPCSYCSADCQNTIEVQPAQYCGNGIIESSEKCEVDGSAIYVATTTVGRTNSTKDIAHNGYQELTCAQESVPAHSLKKGTKSCSDCASGVVRNCIKCGIDPSGVKVEGSVMNVLNTAIVEDGVYFNDQDPLFVKKLAYGALSLSISLCKNSAGEILCPIWLPSVSPLVARALKNTTSDPVSYALLDPHTNGSPIALINSDAICSAGDNFNEKYQMYINYDWGRPLNFPVISDPQSWQYDLVLSPVVSSTKRSRDVRVVVSWVGSGDFYSGILNPFTPIPQTDPPTNPQIEGLSYISGGDTNYAVGVEYYNSPSYFKKAGVWYHGFNSTPGQTNAESFTIDTAAMWGNTYSFYVRSPSYPIRIFKNNSRLKVDVYLPEQDSDIYHFGTPVRTYYLSQTAPSDNQGARYWQVFNINASSSSLSVSDIIGINTIVTGPNNFRYTNPLVAVPACTEADWYGNPEPSNQLTLCPVYGVLSRTWTRITNCFGGVSHPGVEYRSCVPGTYVAF